MIREEDILSMEYLKKSEYTGGSGPIRYRLEGVMVEEEKKLKATIWPKPFNFISTPEEQKQAEFFTFDRDGVLDAIRWMNGKIMEY